jgi:hypothetical protein
MNNEGARRNEKGNSTRLVKEQERKGKTLVATKKKKNDYGCSRLVSLRGNEHKG